MQLRQVRDDELAEVETQHQSATHPLAPPSDVVGVLVEQLRPVIHSGVHARERFGFAQQMEFPGDDEHHVVARPCQTGCDRDKREHVTAIGHRVDHDLRHRPSPCYERIMRDADDRPAVTVDELPSMADAWKPYRSLVSSYLRNTDPDQLTD